MSTLTHCSHARVLWTSPHAHPLLQPLVRSSSAGRVETSDRPGAKRSPALRTSFPRPLHQDLGTAPQGGAGARLPALGGRSQRVSIPSGPGRSSPSPRRLFPARVETLNKGLCGGRPARQGDRPGKCTPRGPRGVPSGRGPLGYTADDLHTLK